MKHSYGKGKTAKWLLSSPESPDMCDIFKIATCYSGVTRILAYVTGKHVGKRKTRKRLYSHSGNEGPGQGMH